MKNKLNLGRSEDLKINFIYWFEKVFEKLEQEWGIYFKRQNDKLGFEIDKQSNAGLHYIWSNNDISLECWLRNQLSNTINGPLMVIATNLAFKY